MPSAAIAAARKWRRARPVELDVAADPIRVDHLAQQDGAAVAELRNEMPELVAGIGHRDRVRPVGDAFAGEDLGSFRAVQPVRVEAEVDRERPVQLDQPRRGDRRGRNPREKVVRQRRIGVLEGEMDRHGRQDRRAPGIDNRLEPSQHDSCCFSVVFPAERSVLAAKTGPAFGCRA
jgi:hypothetical protein